MKKFIRDNPTIAFGLGLPLLLVLAMFLSSEISAIMVAPPEYDLVYATNYTGYNNALRIQVDENKAQAFYNASNGYYPPLPHIWYYNAKTGSVREIAITTPHDGIAGKPALRWPQHATQSESLPIPELEKLSLDANSIAPDGYEFRMSGYNSSPELLTPFFFSSRYRNDAVLFKNGHGIRLPNAESNYYNNSTHFIGWVIP